jgi:hypothetical protein
MFISVNRAAVVLILVLVSRSPRIFSAQATPPANSRGSQHTFPTPSCDAASYGPTHHDYPATDIFVARGTRFLAVTSGIIEAVSRIDRWKPDLAKPWTRGGRFVSLMVLTGAGITARIFDPSPRG